MGDRRSIMHDECYGTESARIARFVDLRQTQV
jgi:hypothetical protein